MGENFYDDNLKLEINNLYLASMDFEESRRTSIVDLITGKSFVRLRNLIGFWILGFCNNFTYWMLITAALDIVSINESNSMNNFDTRQDVNLSLSVICRTTSIGTVLMAETLPAMLITFFSFLVIRTSIHIRVTLVFLFSLIGYYCISFFNHTIITFLGIVCLSLSRGLSDVTFLSYAGQFERNALSTWSSGTGVATFTGPLIYACMTSYEITPQYTILSMSIVPFLIVFSFWIIIKKPINKYDLSIEIFKNSFIDEKKSLALRIARVVEASRIIFPLFVFYIEMYFMNSAFLELIYFPNSWLSYSKQYRWYNATRCLGQMLSRSGHTWFHTNFMWLPVVGHAIILVIMFLEACLHFLPCIWCMFVLLLTEGLLEGTQFKSTMFNIYTNVNASERSESLALMPMAFFLPAVISSLITLPVHNMLCHYFV